MPRALLSRGQKNLPPKCYSILTIPLLDTPRATPVSHKRGAYVTGYEHIPSGMDSNRGLWSSDYLYREASKVGPVTPKVIGRRECLMQRLNEEVVAFSSHL